MPAENLSYSTFPVAPFKIDLLDAAGKEQFFPRHSGLVERFASLSKSGAVPADPGV
jgi:hypothetical protein